MRISHLISHSLSFSLSQHVSSFSSVRLYQNNTFCLTSLPSSSSIIIHYPTILVITLLPAFLYFILYCLLVRAFSSFNRRGGTRQLGLTRYVCTTKVPLLSTSYFLSPNHVVPQLARELLYTGSSPFMHFLLPTAHLRITLCRTSRENCCFESSFPIHFPPPIFESRCASTRARTALHRKFLCYALPTSNYLFPNYVAPQLARELLFTGRSSVMHIPLPTAFLRITWCRKSHENWSLNAAIRYPLPASHLGTTSCRNSRRSCSILELLPTSAAHHAATRARTASLTVPLSSTSYFQSSNHVVPQLA
jgi:hypothetical protein